MKCPNLEQLSAYVDKELTLSEILIVEAHLQDCLSCKIEVSRLEKLIYRFRLLANEGEAIPAPLYIQPPRSNLKWTAIAIALLLLGSALIGGLEPDAPKYTKDEDIEYYYKNHNNFIQSQNVNYFSLVSRE